VTDVATGDPDRAASLLQLKLNALVRDSTGNEGGTLEGSEAAALLRRGDEGWFLAATDPARALGPALAWGIRRGIRSLQVLIDDPDAAGLVARQAAYFEPVPRVWQVTGRALAEALAAPHRPSVLPPPDLETLISLLHEVGAEVAIEHGEVAGEWHGLEIARIVPTDEGPRLEVGVGRNDREAFTLMHGEVPRPAALRAVVDAVRSQRLAGGEGHPLSRLAQERWLRYLVMAEPSVVGAVDLAPIDPISPRGSVKDVAPAAALGSDAEGKPILVVCSVGVDLGLVPEAADLRDRHGMRAGRLIVAVPERDAIPVTRELAAALREPAEIVAFTGDWRDRLSVA
jgi:hypothetical protein